MNENRRKVLEMLSAGQITAEEAERLISALEKESPRAESAGTSEPSVKARPRYMRLVVEPKGGPEDHKQTKVNIRIPLQLIRAGVKLGSLIPPQAREQVDEAMRGHGIHLNLSQINPENLEELIDQFNDFTVDIDEKKEKIRIFCE